MTPELLHNQADNDVFRMTHDTITCARLLEYLAVLHALSRTLA
jgi:hypothetical protein